MNINPNESQREEMLSVNKRQKDYYEKTSAGWVSPVNSFATNIWSHLRRRAMAAVSHDAREKVYDIHRLRLGDLAGKKVLDLGAGSGVPSQRVFGASRQGISRS